MKNNVFVKMVPFDFYFQEYNLLIDSTPSKDFKTAERLKTIVPSSILNLDHVSLVSFEPDHDCVTIVHFSSFKFVVLMSFSEFMKLWETTFRKSHDLKEKTSEGKDFRPVVDVNFEENHIK